MIVCSRRAPMFSVFSFTSNAKWAILIDGLIEESQLDAFRLQERVILFDQRILGSVRMRMKSSIVSESEAQREWETGPEARESDPTVWPREMPRRR